MRALSSLTIVALLALAAPAGAAVSTNQSGWLWGTPEPQGNTLAALELQGTTGYAAGDFGTLLRTNDGGSTWGTVRTGLSLHLLELEMIDANSIIVASACAARRTDDGGQTFRRLPYTSNERGCARPLRGISFPTTAVGYLLPSQGGLLRTTDGGRSFSQRALPGGGGIPNALMFRSVNEGLLVTSGGDIFRTTNGGNSWTREFDGGRELRALLYTNAQAVVVGDGGTFLVSEDGGDTWTQPAADPGAPSPPDDTFYDVSCGSATVCLATGRTVYRTADGGRSFTDAGVNSASETDFASATRAVTVGFAGETNVSNDGGASFSPVGSRLASIGSVLTRVRATSTSVAHAFGDEAGTLVRTVDGGESWVDVGVPTASGLRDAWFPTASVGYALDTDGGLFRTENGGGSWSILDSGAANPVGVYAPDASHVYVIGLRGVVRSNDSGETFERHTHRVVRNRTLYEADQAGSAVVFWGPRVIALSTNRGDTFQHINRPTRAEIVHVDFISPRAGYVLERGGRVQFTSDRGRSWTELLTGYSNGRRLAFATRRNGWLSLGSTHPGVLRTNDGGKTWTPQILGAEHTLGIAAAGSQTGFATLSGFAKALFTRSGGRAGAGSALRLSTPDRTVRSGQKIEIRGRLSPADGAEDVEVRVRGLRSRRWVEVDVTPNRAGKFSFERRIRRATVFVAQWEGDPDSNGDGSRPLVVQVGG